MRSLPRTQSIAWLFLVLASTASYRPAVHAAAPLTKVLVTTGSSSERVGALYVVQDQGYCRKYGLDVTLVQVRNGPVGVVALSSGESLMHWGSVSAENLGAIAEGADLMFVAGFINKLTGAFAASPKIKSPAELKGRSLGVTNEKIPPVKGGRIGGR
jgi:ABC-type nitrate/sulfonate/bicarbonate transport system substrate-binding protein